MAIGELLRAFENEELLPIDLNAVGDWIVQKGIQDKIRFIGVDLEIEIIRASYTVIEKIPACTQSRSAMLISITAVR